MTFIIDDAGKKMNFASQLQVSVQQSVPLALDECIIIWQQML